MSRTGARGLTLTLLLAMPAATVWAVAPGAPRSFAGGVAPLQSLAPESVPFVPPPAAAMAPAAASGGPVTFATRVDVRLGADKAGAWERLADGSSLWRLRIASPGARSLNLAFATFDLPRGASLWLYRPDRSEVRGPYTGADASPDGQLWTPIVQGDEVVVELSVPKGEKKRVRLELTAVNQGFRDLVVSEQDLNLPCYTDVVCPQADPWRDQVNAVALYSQGGVISCTGTLLNDTSYDYRPFFLTAHHCLNEASNLASVVVYWNYQSPVCGEHGGGSLAQSQSGVTLRATWADSDFTLIELARRPDPGFHVYYAGWNATGDTPTSAVVITHPKAEKVISFVNHPLTAVNTSLETSPPPLVWWFVNPYTEGTTDNGSSGSCLFDENKLCVGTLIDGTPASCALTQDWYGQLSRGWIGGGTPATSLRAWLDARGTGALTLNGSDPYPPANQVRRMLHAVH